MRMNVLAREREHVVPNVTIAQMASVPTRVSTANDNSTPAVVHDRKFAQVNERQRLVAALPLDPFREKRNEGAVVLQGSTYYLYS